MATTPKPTSTRRKSTAAGRTTRSRSTAAAKAKTSPAKAKPADATPAGPAAAPASASDKPDMFRRPDLIGAVAERSAIKRADAKAVLDLVLEELGKALEAQDELALQPLGRVSVKKRKDTGNGSLLTLKLKRPATGLTKAPAAAAPKADDTVT
ncbi:MAG: HU family DNA-binding protein [Pseudomonadota bacterium]